METLVALIVIVIIISLSIFKIVREKRKGAKCIGCPFYDKDGSCSKK